VGFGKALPWLNVAGEIALTVCLLILLPLTFFRRTRPWPEPDIYRVLCLWHVAIRFLVFSGIPDLELHRLDCWFVFRGSRRCACGFPRNAFSRRMVIVLDVVFGMVLTFGTRASDFG